MAQNTGNWQLLLLWIYSLVLGFIFILGAYGTSAQWATIIYELTTFIWGTVLFLLKWGKFRNSQMPFGWVGNAPAYAYGLALFLVPVIYALAQSLTFITTGQLDTGRLIPEVLSKFFSLADIPAILPSIGQVGVGLQQLGLQFGDVSPAEELFKTAVIDSLLVVVMWAFNKHGVGKGLTFLTLSGVNGLWTLMHGILAYHTLPDFLIAFVSGEVILAPTWFFGNPFPSVITHALWNFDGSFSLLTFWPMVIWAGITGVLTFYLYHKRKKA